MEIIILLVIGWFLIGFCSFIYWWTKDYNFTTNNIRFAFFASFFGPFSFIAGWTIHGNFNKIVIKKKRTTQNE